jgi:hypothetical protein
MASCLADENSQRSKQPSDHHCKVTMLDDSMLLPALRNRVNTVISHSPVRHAAVADPPR